MVCVCVMANTFSKMILIRHAISCVRSENANRIGEGGEEMHKLIYSQTNTQTRVSQCPFCGKHATERRASESRFLLLFVPPPCNIVKCACWPVPLSLSSTLIRMVWLLCFAFFIFPFFVCLLRSLFGGDIKMKMYPSSQLMDLLFI